VFVSYLYFLLLNLTRLLVVSLACLYSQIATSASSLQVDKYGLAEQTRFEQEGGVADASVSKISLREHWWGHLPPATGCVNGYTVPPGGDGDDEICCSGDIVISTDITKVEDKAFNDCYEIASVTIPTNVVSIGDFVFESCSGVTGISA
jgi:hypothetical protein